MQSTNSYFNKTLYKKQMMRFWPLWGAYGLIMLMAMPLYYIMNLSVQFEFPKEFATDFVLNMATSVAPWISAFAGILGAMAVWSYLYNSRSVGMIHALPIKREGLFFTNYLAGLSFLILPTLVIFVLTLGAETIGGVVDVRNLAIWLMCQCLTYLFFFSFATLIAFITGVLLALPALYVIFNGLAAGVTMLLENTFSNFVYGFQSAQPLNAVGFWLTPLALFARKLDVTSMFYDEALERTVELHPAQVVGLPIVAGAALIGLVMAGLALVLYSRRKLELAGEVVAVPWLRPVFKYSVALCGSLALGNACYAMFSYSLPEGIITMLFFLLLWGAVFYFAAEMLLKKTFRIFKKSWRGCVTLLCVIVACVLVMELDVTGYEKSVPNVDEIEGVYIYGSDLYVESQSRVYLTGVEDPMDGTIPIDPAYIAQVVDLHTSLVNGKREVETRLAQGNIPTDSPTNDEEGLPITRQGIQSLHIMYEMKNGSWRERVYEIPVTELLLQDPASPAAKLDGLVNDARWRSEKNLPGRYHRDEVVSASINNFTLATREETGDQQLENNEKTLTKEEAQRLYDAVKEDLAANRLGRYWLYQTEEFFENQYVNDLSLTFYGTYYTDDTGKPMKTTKDVYIPLQTTATSTLAVLKDLGLTDGAGLYTQADSIRMDAYFLG